MSASVLFLCTGNSARSILAEVILNTVAGDSFRAFSAGSFPVGAVNPTAIETLSKNGHDTSGLRSKSWDEFAGDNAVPIDVVVTVCNNAAGETCPVWNGSPTIEHWGLKDPAAIDDPALRLEAFAKTYAELQHRIRDFVERYGDG